MWNMSKWKKTFVNLANVKHWAEIRIASSNLRKIRHPLFHSKLLAMNFIEFQSKIDRGNTTRSSVLWVWSTMLAALHPARPPNSHDISWYKTNRYAVHRQQRQYKNVKNKPLHLQSIQVSQQTPRWNVHPIENNRWQKQRNVNLISLCKWGKEFERYRKN